MSSPVLGCKRPRPAKEKPRDEAHPPKALRRAKPQTAMLANCTKSPEIRHERKIAPDVGRPLFGWAHWLGDIVCRPRHKLRPGYNGQGQPQTAQAKLRVQLVPHSAANLQARSPPNQQSSLLVSATQGKLQKRNRVLALERVGVKRKTAVGNSKTEWAETGSRPKASNRGGPEEDFILFGEARTLSEEVRDLIVPRPRLVPTPRHRCMPATLQVADSKSPGQGHPACGVDCIPKVCDKSRNEDVTGTTGLDLLFPGHATLFTVLIMASFDSAHPWRVLSGQLLVLFSSHLPTCWSR